MVQTVLDYLERRTTQVVVDSDGDGLNSDEVNVHGTDPNDADSDDDELMTK